MTLTTHRKLNCIHLKLWMKTFTILFMGKRNLGWKWRFTDIFQRWFHIFHHIFIFWKYLLSRNYVIMCFGYRPVVLLGTQFWSGKFQIISFLFLKLFFLNMPPNERLNSTDLPIDREVPEERIQGSNKWTESGAQHS